MPYELLLLCQRVEGLAAVPIDPGSLDFVAGSHFLFRPLGRSTAESLTSTEPMTNREGGFPSSVQPTRDVVEAR